MFYKDNTESEGLIPVAYEKTEPVTADPAATVTAGGEQNADGVGTKGEEAVKDSGETLNVDELGEAETVKDEFFTAKFTAARNLSPIELTPLCRRTTKAKRLKTQSSDILPPRKKK